MTPLKSVSELLPSTSYTSETKNADGSQPRFPATGTRSFKTHWTEELAKDAGPLKTSGQTKLLVQSKLSESTRSLDRTSESDSEHTLQQPLKQSKDGTSSLVKTDVSDEAGGTVQTEVSKQAVTSQAVPAELAENLLGRGVQTNVPTCVLGQSDSVRPGREASYGDKTPEAEPGVRNAAKKHSEEGSAPTQPTTDIPMLPNAQPVVTPAQVHASAPLGATVPARSEVSEVVSGQDLRKIPEKLVAAQSKAAPGDTGVLADASIEPALKTAPGRTSGETETLVFAPVLHASGSIVSTPGPVSEILLPVASRQQEAVYMPALETHISPEHGRWTANSAAAEPALFTASPGSLEVGVQSVSHGWVRVRAEVDQHTGSVSAVMLAPTAHTAASLGRDLPAMQAFLVGEHVAVGSLTVSHERLLAGQPLSADMQNQSGSGRQERSDSGASLQTSAGETSDLKDLTADARVPAVSSGGRLNVLA